MSELHDAAKAYAAKATAGMRAGADESAGQAEVDRIEAMIVSAFEAGARSQRSAIANFVEAVHRETVKHTSPIDARSPGTRTHPL